MFYLFKHIDIGIVEVKKMERKLWKMVISLIVIAMFAGAFTGTSSALGISNVNFGDVEQGKTYTQIALIVTSSAGFDNHFIMEKEGDLADWITISPMEFDLKAGDTKNITVTLTVPEDTKLGLYKGTITAAGQRAAPVSGSLGGAAVGYRVATKSNAYATVVKPGAVEAVTILSVIAPKRVEPGSAAKFDVAIKNTGNIPTTASPTLTVSKGAETVATIPGVAIELKVEEEKTAKLYWDAQEEGTYTAVVAVTCGETTTTSEPIRIKVSKGGFSIPSVPAFAVIAAILAAFILLRLKRKR